MHAAHCAELGIGASRDPCERNHPRVRWYLPCGRRRHVGRRDDHARVVQALFESGAKALAELYDVLAGLVRAGRVAWVHMCASGLDVPLFFPLMKACHEASVTITHCPGVHAVPIAQYCLGHILSICRMGPTHAANQARRSYTSLLQRDARMCTVGVVGAGGIGTEVARLSKAFGMRVLGWRRQAAPAPNYDEVLSGDDGLAAVLSTSDFVVVAVPKTASMCSRHRIFWWWRCPRRRCALDFGFCGGGGAQDGGHDRPTGRGAAEDDETKRVAHQRRQGRGGR